MSLVYEKQILSLLLDWYESSPAYVRGEFPARRRNLHLYGDSVSDFPLYDIENPTVRKDINYAVLALAERGLVEYQWLRGQRGHIIEKAWLRYESIDSAYAFVKRQPKNKEVDEAIAQLEALAMRSKEPWMTAWVAQTLDDVKTKRSIGAALPANEQERQDLIKALLFLADETKTEILERVFSTLCFGNSKRFENTVKSRLVRIIKRYLAVESDCSDEAALRLVGIVRYPEHFEFCGPLTVVLPDGSVDFSPLSYGAIISSDDVAAGSFLIAAHVKRILSIENKANYIDYIHKKQLDHELVLFHGGQYSPAKGVFLKKIAEAMPYGCTLFHWGDIDYGGFSMLARLRREIEPSTTALHMNTETLKRYAAYCLGFAKPYENKLKALLTVPELAGNYDCIAYMLEKGVRLEQEALLMYQS